MPEFTLLHFLLCLLFFGIGFVTSKWLRVPSVSDFSQKRSSDVSGEIKPEVSVATPQESCCPQAQIAQTDDAQAISEMVEQVRCLTDNVRTDVHQHTQSVEQISNDLVTISQVSDTDSVTRIISRLMEANRQLDSQLNVAETRLQEQSQLLRSHRVEARTDALTGLPNRRVFDEELDRLFEQKRASKRPSTLIMVDIDHFKEFNDLHGHQAGDYCLKKVGEVTRQTVRGIGGIVMRYGGEEFAVLLPGTELFDAKIAAQRLNRHVEKLDVEFEGKTLSVTASLGIAEIGRDSDASEWLSRADRALYAAKKLGRNRGCWHDGHACHEITRRNVDPAAEPNEEVAGIAKREAFIQDVNRRLALFHRKRQPLALILASIDPVDGKSIEQHPDFVAIQHAVMQVFGTILRDMDHVCQMSENQFGALLPAASGSDAAIVAERARRALSQLEMKTPTDMVSISLSCGVSQALEGDEAEHLLSRCEAGLDAARRKNGNAVYLVRHEMDWETPHRVTPEVVIAD